MFVYLLYHAIIHLKESEKLTKERMALCPLLSILKYFNVHGTWGQSNAIYFSVNWYIWAIWHICIERET